MRERLVHPYPPVYDRDSHILILGSFPSVKSREEGFYYAHPQNRFYRVLSALFGCETPRTTEEKRAMLLRFGVALWDVIAECDIEGSSDASIRGAVPNDIAGLLRSLDIRGVYANGAAAHSLYMRYVYPDTGVPAVRLPSTSPANASYSRERLISEWSVILG